VPVQHARSLPQCSIVLFVLTHHPRWSCWQTQHAQWWTSHKFVSHCSICMCCILRQAIRICMLNHMIKTIKLTWGHTKHRLVTQYTYNDYVNKSDMLEAKVTDDATDNSCQLHTMITLLQLQVKMEAVIIKCLEKIHKFQRVKVQHVHLHYPGVLNTSRVALAAWV